MYAITIMTQINERTHMCASVIRVKLNVLGARFGIDRRNND